MHSTCTRLLVMDMAKPEAPRARIRRTRAHRRRRAAGRSRRITRRPVRKHSTHTAEQAWEITVARAAPRTPMPSRKMKMGSSTMFTTAPRATVSMPMPLNPWELMKGFMPRPIMTKTVPST